MQKSSRNILDCDPELQEIIPQILMDCVRELPQGDVVIIAQTYRSNADQMSAWQCGRDADGNVVDALAIKTYCKPGTSEHNCTDALGRPQARAVDLLILRHGRVVGDGKDPSYIALGVIGKRYGLEWSGDWHHSFEAAHFQIPREL